MTTKPIPNSLHNAIRAIEAARRQLQALYLDIDPDDPGYEVACAETTVPVHLRPLSESLHEAYEHVLHLREFGGD